LLSIYIGFKKPLRDLGNRHYSTFAFDENVKKLSQFIENMKNTDFHRKGYVFVDYSQINSGLTGTDKSLGVIVTVDYLSNWENLTEEAYKNKKEEVAQIFINKLERLIPGSKKQIEYYEVGTTKTIQRYTKNPAGTPYGYAQTPQQANIKRIDYKSPIGYLYFASAWTKPGGGFTGAILSGYNCAKIILD
jgi:phytoene dehydrogenase-like protein